MNASGDEFCDADEVVAIRVYDEGPQEGWQIDGVSADGRYTESCWNRDGDDCPKLESREHALKLVPDFCETAGIRKGLPIIDPKAGDPIPQTLDVRAIPGGFDGVLVSFGEGTDDDTINMVLGQYLGGDKVSKLTFKDGFELEATEGWFQFHEGEVVVWFRQFDAEAGEATGDPMMRRFDDLIRLEVQ